LHLTKYISSSCLPWCRLPVLYLEQVYSNPPNSSHPSCFGSPTGLMLLKLPPIVFSGDTRIIHSYYAAKPCSPFRHKNAVSLSRLWICSLNLVLSTSFACIGQNIFLGTFISKELIILTIFQGTDYIDDFLRKSLCFTNIYDKAADRILYSIIQKARYNTYKRISHRQAIPLHLTTETDQISKRFVSEISER